MAAWRLGAWAHASLQPSRAQSPTQPPASSHCLNPQITYPPTHPPHAPTPHPPTHPVRPPHTHNRTPPHTTRSPPCGPLQISEEDSIAAHVLETDEAQQAAEDSMGFADEVARGGVEVAVALGVSTLSAPRARHAQSLWCCGGNHFCDVA